LIKSEPYHLRFVMMSIIALFEERLVTTSTPANRRTAKFCRSIFLKILNFFQLIWKWLGRERIRCLLWKLVHKVLLTNAERARLRIAENDLCPRCNNSSESSEAPILQKWRRIVSNVYWHHIMSRAS
jgi:hypothetical protein